MKLCVELNMSWRKLIVSPKDFVTLAEIFDRAEVVDIGYSEKSGLHLIKEERRLLTCEQVTHEPITREQFEIIRTTESTQQTIKEETHENLA